MSVKGSMSYRSAGVLDNTELGLRALLGWVNRTADFRRPGEAGRKAIDVGFYASVVEIGHGLGLALCTDGVGTKVLVAQMLERYDTIGIDCVAMNVNDAICVGAEPISFLDYIAVEAATPAVLEEIGKGLYEGARQAGVTIVGGEISQMPAVIKGERPGDGLDLVGMCAGIVPLDRIILGREVQPGDAIVGLASDGLHSNGFTLARKALFEAGGLRADERVAELGATVGEELLRPTRIYVAPIMSLLRDGVPVRALAHITSDGFLNLARIDAAVGFRLHRLPRPGAIFDLIQRTGGISVAEMYRVFNMGVGFCLIVPDDPAVIAKVVECARAHEIDAQVIGHVVDDPARRVLLPEQGLVGEGEAFTARTS
jgi:phosphoribosylformylglycinamidine cyclo-ligase